MPRITKEYIAELLEEISKFKNDDADDITFPRSMHLLGTPVIVSKHIQDLEPVIKLSDKVTVSTAFRNKCNQHYIDVYGYKVPDIFRMRYGFVMGENMKNLLVGNLTA